MAKRRRASKSRTIVALLYLSWGHNDWGQLGRAYFHIHRDLNYKRDNISAFDINLAPRAVDDVWP